ncbi:MAG: hypothetical protein WBF93_15675 [Pirellulales bacterium]
MRRSKTLPPRYSSDLMTELAAILAEAGLARRTDAISAMVDTVPLKPRTNLIPPLLDTWRTEPSERSNAAEWLSDQHRRGAALTVGYAGKQEHAARAWLGLRLAWWPSGIPSGRRVGVACSRLGRRLDRQQAWFDVLRAACGKIDRRLDVLVSSGDSAAAALVRRAAELFDLRLLTIETPTDDEAALQQWLERLTRTTVDSHDSIRQVFLSPPLASEPMNDRAIEASGPFRDRALAAMSDRLLIFHLRRRGNWHRLLSQRLDSHLFPPASVHVAMGRELVSARCAAQLLDAGAVGWVVPQALNVDVAPAMARPVIVSRETPHGQPAIIELPAGDPWEYLTHCTRRCNGAWPDQTEDEYLEQLILQDEESDRSALAALLRIIKTRTLRGSSEGIRGKSAVVCFTAVPLDELQRMRTFRAHRARWDFEPYGICIRQDWLEQRDAQPVHYGNQKLWESLPENERPFFQVSHSTGGRQVIDWTAEREWRHAGNVALDQLPDDAAFVFVSSEDDAERVAAISPWPVAVVGSPGKDRLLAGKPR